MATIAPPHAPKGGRLLGGATSDEAIASSPSVVTEMRGKRNGTTGLQQFFTPPEAARLIGQVIGTGGTAFDPTAGSGALLSAWPAEHRFGVEIDADHADTGDYEAITGDIQRIYPLMRLAQLRFDAVVANPPFGLEWTAPDGTRVNSSVQTMRYCMGLLAPIGICVLIVGRNRWYRELAGLPEAAGLWALIEVDDLFDTAAIDSVIAFFCQPGRRGSVTPRTWQNERAGLVDLADEVTTHGHTLTYTGRYLSGANVEPTRAVIRAIGAEHRAIRARAAGTRPAHDLSLAGGRIRGGLRSFAQITLQRRGELELVRRMVGQSPSYFAVNGRDWRVLSRAADDGVLSLDPALTSAIEAARARAEQSLLPMYPLPIQQRLGWLDQDGDGRETILCTTSDPERGFSEGERYPVRVRTTVVTHDEERPSSGRNGEVTVRRFRKSRKRLAITIGSTEFAEDGESIAYLTSHFQMPDPGDLERRLPGAVEAGRRDLDAIATANGYQLRRFQREDLARLLVKGSGMVALEQGLGKTLCLMSLAAATTRRGAADQALFVVPQDLIDQWQAEATKFFGRTLEVIRTPAQARDVARRARAGESGWWITYYEALSIVGRKAKAAPKRMVLAPRDYYALPAAERAGAVKNPRAEAIGGSPDEIRLSALTTSEVCPNCLANNWSGWKRPNCTSCGHNDMLARSRSCASHLATAFRRGSILIDEVSLIAGESLRSTAIRGLRARHRYVASGTPIKNFVPDLFWPLWWALGEGERFPYGYDEGRAKFESDFCVIEHAFGTRADDAHKTVRRKVLPEVSNLSMLWRLLCSGMVRRRKEDTGEPIVPRTIHPITVPAGVNQLQRHGEWLRRFPDFFCQKFPDHPVVEAGLVEKFAAALGQLWKLEFTATMPGADPDADWLTTTAHIGGAASNWTPKNLRVLEIARREADAGRKIVLFSDLIETGRWICDRLQEAGVRAVHITETDRDGKITTKAPRKRAAEIRAFADGDAQVLCVGIQALRLGWNLDCAQVAIVAGLPWSHEALDQAIARVHRLTSRHPVDVYVVLTRGTIDERKWDLLSDKAATADLALDGRLVEEDEKPVDWQQVITQMRRAGVRPTGDELDEADIEDLWRASLAPADTPPVTPAPVPPAPARPTRPRVEPPLIEDDGGQMALLLPLETKTTRIRMSIPHATPPARTTGLTRVGCRRWV